MPDPATAPRQSTREMLIFRSLNETWPPAVVHALVWLSRSSEVWNRGPVSYETPAPEPDGEPTTSWARSRSV